MTELDEKKVEVITLRAELADNRVSKCKFSWIFGSWKFNMKVTKIFSETGNSNGEYGPRSNFETAEIFPSNGSEAP